MTVMAMMQILFRMSLQGSIIIGIILLLRMVFRGLRISYRYCVLLWGIAFFYLIFPWKIWQYADTAQGTLLILRQSDKEHPAAREVDYAGSRVSPDSES